MVNFSKRASVAAKSPSCSGLAPGPGNAGEENTILSLEAPELAPGRSVIVAVKRHDLEVPPRS